MIYKHKYFNNYLSTIYQVPSSPVRETSLVKELAAAVSVPNVDLFVREKLAVRTACRGG